MQEGADLVVQRVELVEFILQLGDCRFELFTLFRHGFLQSTRILTLFAVNPASGRAYLSVSRGKGPQAPPAIVRVVPGGTLELVSLDKVKHSSLSLDDAPEDAVTGEGRRRRNKRMESITDLAYLDGKVVIAGLSNEEFASTLRSALFPFEGDASTTSVEIFHGAHGRLETASPIRTFLPMLVGEKVRMRAALDKIEEIKGGLQTFWTMTFEVQGQDKPACVAQAIYRYLE